MQVTYQTVSGLAALKETPLPSSHKQWPRAIPHDELAEAALQACMNMGWSVSSPESVLSADKGSAFTVWKCSTESSPLAVGLLNHSVGTAKSKTARGPITMFAGIFEGVTEPDAPIWLAEHKLIRIQHQRFDPKEECGWAIDKLSMQARKWGAIIAKLKETPVDPAETDALLFAASREGLIAFSRLKWIDIALREEKERTGWALLRAFATTIKLSPPHEQGKNGVEFARTVTAKLNIKGV